jgi:hypothetical protein
MHAAYADDIALGDRITLHTAMLSDVGGRELGSRSDVVGVQRAATPAPRARTLIQHWSYGAGTVSILADGAVWLDATPALTLAPTELEALAKTFGEAAFDHMAPGARGPRADEITLACNGDHLVYGSAPGVEPVVAALRAIRVRVDAQFQHRLRATIAPVAWLDWPASSDALDERRSRPGADVPEAMWGRLPLASNTDDITGEALVRDRGKVFLVERSGDTRSKDFVTAFACTSTGVRCRMLPAHTLANGMLVDAALADRMGVPIRADLEHDEARNKLVVQGDAIVHAIVIERERTRPR